MFLRPSALKQTLRCLLRIIPNIVFYPCSTQTKLVEIMNCEDIFLELKTLQRIFTEFVLRRMSEYREP